MPRVLLLSGLVVLFGCDAFGSADVLPPATAGATGVADLRAAAPWIAVSAVSDGEAVRFPDSLFTATFSADGTVFGRTSANHYGGDYSARDGGSLKVGSLGTTLIGESGDRVRLSVVLLTELREAERFEVADGELLVRSADGDGVRFRAGGR